MQHFAQLAAALVDMQRFPHAAVALVDMQRFPDAPAASARGGSGMLTRETEKMILYRAFESCTGPYGPHSSPIVR